MPSYCTRRGIAPKARKQTLEEVKARIRNDIQERTEARVRYWNAVAKWCNSKPGRFVRVNWDSTITTWGKSIRCVEGPD